MYKYPIQGLLFFQNVLIFNKSILRHAFETTFFQKSSFLSICSYIFGPLYFQIAFSCFS